MLMQYFTSSVFGIWLGTMASSHLAFVKPTQGWKFALWLFVQMAHFLWVKEQNSNFFEEITQLLFFKERRDQIAHSRSSIWAILSKRAKIECAKEWIPNPAPTWRHKLQICVHAWLHTFLFRAFTCFDLNLSKCKCAEDCAVELDEEVLANHSWLVPNGIPLAQNSWLIEPSKESGPWNIQYSTTHIMSSGQ